MSGSEKRDYYEVLGIGRDADERAVKDAYRRLAREFHPDKNPGNPDAEERFKEAAEAYEVLADPERRARYDRFGHAGAGHQGFADVSSIFGGSLGDILGSLFGVTDRRGGGRGSNLGIEIDVPFDDMARGAERTITLKRAVPCDTCRGSGSADGRAPERCPTCRGQGAVARDTGYFTMRQTCPRCGGEGRVVANPCRTCSGEGNVAGRREIAIRIPAGVYDGAVLRVSGEGEPGARGAPPGDLHVGLRIAPHPFFRRSQEDPADLWIDVPVALSVATLGGSVEVPTLDGTVSVDIAPGTPPGEVVRVRGGGLPRFQRGGRGHLLVRVQYDVPRKPSKALKRALEGLGEVERGEPGPARREFDDLVRQHRRSTERNAKGQA